MHGTRASRDPDDIRHTFHDRLFRQACPCPRPSTRRNVSPLSERFELPESHLTPEMEAIPGVLLIYDIRTLLKDVQCAGEKGLI